MSDHPFRLLTVDEIEAFWNDPANEDVRAFPRMALACAVAVPLSRANGTQCTVQTAKTGLTPRVLIGPFGRHKRATLPAELNALARAFDRHERAPEGMTAANVARWLRRYRERQAGRTVT
jgi:hypothetical protein